MFTSSLYITIILIVIQFTGMAILGRLSEHRFNMFCVVVATESPVAVAAPVGAELSSF
jgi:hypothetical protein